MSLLVCQSAAMLLGVAMPSQSSAEDFVAVDLGTNPDVLMAFELAAPGAPHSGGSLAALSGNFTRGIDFDSATSGYVVHSSSLDATPPGLYRFANGSATMLSALPMSTPNDCGLTLSSDASCLFFSLGISRANDVLYRVSLQGVFTQVGAISRPDGVSSDVIGLAMTPDGRLFGADTSDDSLLVIDPVTARAMRIGGFGQAIGDFGGLDFDEASGQLVLAGQYIGTRLFTVNTSTGAATPIGELPFLTSALAYAPAVTGHCVLDLANESGAGQPDGAVNINDLLYFLRMFEGGTANADLDNGTNTFTPDGAVNVDDLICFLFNFEGGC